ncbi:MAG: hypothetical protein ACFFC0_10060, partial [Promethearchaeota archaeon]
SVFFWAILVLFFVGPLTRPERFRWLGWWAEFAPLFAVITAIVNLAAELLWHLQGLPASPYQVGLIVSTFFLCLAIPVLFLRRSRVDKTNDVFGRASSTLLDRSTNDALTFSLTIQLVILAVLAGGGLSVDEMIYLVAAAFLAQLVVYLLSALYRGTKLQM